MSPRDINIEICGRLGLDPSKTKEILIRLSPSTSEVVVRRILTDTDAKLIGDTIESYRLVEIDGRET